MSLSEAVYTANKLYKVVIMLLKRVYIYLQTSYANKYATIYNRIVFNFLLLMNDQDEDDVRLNICVFDLV